MLNPENPMEEFAQNSSQVPLESSYKHLVNGTSNEKGERTEKKEQLKEEKKNDEEKQQEEKEEIKPNQEKEENNASYGESSEEKENSQGQTGNGESELINKESPYVEIIDPEDVVKKEKEQNDFFTTTIKNKETVTKKEYSFRIKQKKHEYKVKSVDVYLNKTLQQKFDGSVILDEDENTITVKVTYQDKKGKMFTVSKTYTVYLKVEKIVIQTDLKDKDIVEKPELTFTAWAEKDGKELPVNVLLKNKKIKEDSKHQYFVQLKEGENKITISASHKDKKIKKTYLITYQKEKNNLIIDTDLKDQQVDVQAFSFNAVAKNGEKAVTLSVSVNEKSLDEQSDGQYSTTLQEGENNIKLTATYKDEALIQNYVITYVVPQSGEQQEKEKDKNAHAPTITVFDIKEGEVIKNSQRTFHVKAFDYKGKSLTTGNGIISVSNNGNPVQFGWKDSSQISFKLNIQNGHNSIVITGIDEEGNKGVYELVVIGQVAEEFGSVGTVTISLEATTIGLGYLIPPVQVEIYQGERASHVLDRLFKEYGIEYTHTGKHENSFYLSAIYKPGIVTNPIIPADLAELLQRDMDRFEPEDYLTDSLGEFDFSNGSGWMYSVNGNYPNVGFADYYFKDGDVVRIRFTLAYGADIGGGMPGSDYAKEW